MDTSLKTHEVDNLVGQVQHRADPQMEVDSNPRIRARSELPEGWAGSRFDVLNGLGDEGDVEPTITHLKNKLQALQGSRVRRKESSSLGKHVGQSSKGLEAQSGK